MTPTEELRQAAEKLRARAEKMQTEEAGLREMNSWFNSVGPDIGRPLARLLEAFAEPVPGDRSSHYDRQAAIAIARAVNDVKDWPPEEEPATR